MQITQTAIFLGLLSLLASCSNKPKTAKEVLVRSAEAYSKVENAEYDIHYSIKYLTDKDTSYYTAHTKQQVLDNDTFVGAAVSITQDSSVHLYDGDTLMVLIPHNKRAIYATPEVSGIRMLTGNVADNLMYEPFHKGFDTTDLFADSVKLTLSTHPDNYEVYAEIPDDENTQNRTRRYFINKKTMLVERFESNVTWMNMEQHIIIELKNIKVNSDKFKSIKASIPEGYETKNADLEVDKPRVLPLAEGETAPTPLETECYDGQMLPLAKASAKLRLLDFWYMSCGPCQMSIPHLKDLRKKYSKDQLLILGVNSNDRNDQEKMKEFAKEKDLNYPTLIASKKTDSIFQVTGFPTYYLVDENNEIIKTQVGFSEGVMQELDSIIASRL